MKSLTWDQACAQRLSRHNLLKAASSDRLVDVVRDVCGVQAQILSAAELAIGSRVNGVTQQDVRAELWERRGLVKTYGPRGTLHLLAADELPFWMAAMRARETRQDASADLTAAQAAALLEAIGNTLDGRCLTREELAGEVARRVGSWAKEKLESIWGEWLHTAAYRGWLCFGPSQGSKVTFVRADQWIGAWRDVDPDEALIEVLRRYLAAYGPATHQDFAHWFWLKPDDARRVIESIVDELAEVSLDGRRAWVLAADAKVWKTQPKSSLRLLPQYDAYIIGCGPRERIVPKTAQTRVLKYGRGRFEGATGLPILLMDGIVAGMWERRKRGKQIEVRVEPFVRLTALQRDQLEAEALRVAEFLGVESILSIGALE